MKEMNSMRKKIVLSLLFISLTMILIISLSAFGGFIYLNGLWEDSVAEEASIILNKKFASADLNLDDLDELSDMDLNVISIQTAIQYDGIIKEIHYFNRSGAESYVFINGIITKDQDFYRLHLLRILDKINHYFKIRNSLFNCELINGDQESIGFAYIIAFPVLNSVLIGQYDKIISISILIGLVVTILFSLIIALYLSKKISLTSRTFASQLIRLSEGERNLEFKFKGTDELQTSAEAAQKLQSQLQLNDDIQRQMIQDVLHDIVTPVSAISIQLEAVKEGVLKLNEDRINIILKENDTIKDIINELSIFTRQNSKDYSWDQEGLNINNIVKDVCDIFSSIAEKKEQVITYEKPTRDILLAVNRPGLIRVLNNLLANALHNAPGNSEVILSVCIQKHRITKEEIVVIEIENSGYIEEEDIPFIFNRLYRGKGSDYKGSGLGLAISKSIVEKNRGHISLKNSSHGTVVFRVEFPKRDS